MCQRKRNGRSSDATREDTTTTAADEGCDEKQVLTSCNEMGVPRAGDLQKKERDIHSDCV